MIQRRRQRLLAGRFFAWVALLHLIFVTPSSAAPTPSTTTSLSNRPPNILLIIADDLGYGDLGCYGQRLIRTPNLDRLAAQGVRFSDFYSGHTSDGAARRALATGRHPTSPGPEIHRVLRSNDVTLASVLKSRGYATAVIGKWGLGTDPLLSGPQKHGVDEWFGYLEDTAGGDHYPTALWRNAHLLQLPANANGHKAEYALDWFVRGATNFINSASNQTWFLQLSVNIPRPNPALFEETGNGMEVPTDAPYTKETWPPAERNKAAMITRLDRHVGTLLAQITRLGLERSTVVVFCSDQGAHAEGGVHPEFFKSTGPFRGTRGSLHEGGLRVPLILRWPGTLPAGAIQTQPWAAWDLAPSLAQMANTSLPGSIEGRSFADALVSKGPPPGERTFVWPGTDTTRAIRRGNWKAITGGPAPELYDLTEDPGERTNLATLKPALLQTLLQARTTTTSRPAPQ